MNQHFIFLEARGRCESLYRSAPENLRSSKGRQSESEGDPGWAESRNSNGTPDSIAAAHFLSLVYRNGGGAFFDAIAYHASGEGALENWLADALLGTKYVMAANGDVSKPIWITEMGCYTSGPGSVSEAWQAEYLGATRMFLARLPDVERVYWYTLRDANTSADPEMNHGLFRADGTPKLAVKAFSAPFGN
jgi:Glycosyl hydrolase catalytic core